MAAAQGSPVRRTAAPGLRVLGINAVFHDPAAALVVGGEIVAAAERSASAAASTASPRSRSPPGTARAGRAGASPRPGCAPTSSTPSRTPADPALAAANPGDPTADEWEGLRTLYAQRAPLFLATALPGLDPVCVRFVPHHVAHAASAYLAAPFRDSAVLVCDGRGEAKSHLGGIVRDGSLEVLIDVTRWLHDQTGATGLTLAGGVALNCVANARLWGEGLWERIWVQPAAGDAGTRWGPPCRPHELAAILRRGARQRRRGGPGSRVAASSGPGRSAAPGPPVTTTSDVAVSTIGRQSLDALLESLAAARGPLPTAILLVDDLGLRLAPTRRTP